MKLSPIKILLLFLLTVLFFCSQTVAYACSMEQPNIEFRCLNKMVAAYNHIAEAYAIDKTLSSDPYLAEILQKNPRRIQRDLEQLDPCYDDLSSIVTLYNDAAAAIQSKQVQWTGVFRFTPTTKDVVINDDAAWYRIPSCLYPWRMKTDE